MSADTDKVAVITDIHGNLPALQAAFARVEELGIESVFCGGDLVGYGPHPNEVCALIAERDIPTIYGLCAAAHNAYIHDKRARICWIASAEGVTL